MVIKQQGVVIRKWWLIRMRQLFNLPSMKDLRRQLRNEPTTAEWILWQQLKGSQLGWKFRRQQGVGSYVVDFYCPKAKLVVEVDGDTHFEPEAIIYDEDRTAFFNEHGIRVLRVTNIDVYESLEDVVEMIKEALTTTQ